MSDRSRAIIHLDLDAFYAAVEVLQKPELAELPVLVGGLPGGRGVVASASYSARAFGVRSAMPTSRALALCPEAVVLPPRFSLYHDYSRRVMYILQQTSSLVQQVSIDEAYIDVTEQSGDWEEAIRIAEQLQHQVLEDVGLSASLGVATNKLVAKIASDYHKPGGLTIVRPGEEPYFLAPLPVRVLWGVGPVMARKLGALGVTRVGHLVTIPEEELRRHFGRQGAALTRQAKGIDNRPVVTKREPKSVSQERTFSRDQADPQTLEQQLGKMSQKVAARLRSKELAAGTIAVKLRYSDFSTLTRQMTLDVPTNSEDLISQAAQTLLQRAWQTGRPVRLLGVAARRLTRPAGQIPLL